MRVAIVVCVLALGAQADPWPFGGGRFSKWDLYNLGMIGAKASDAAGPALVKNAPPRGGRRSFTVDKPNHDDGPTELRVELLLPDGPAANAGLVRGDVIVGIGGKRFRDGSMPALAKALRTAESKDGQLVLTVRRGSGDTQKVTLTFPAGGKVAAKPTTGAGRKRLVDGALAWLAERQDPDGGFVETLSGKNGAVVQAALAGLAWLGAGNDLQQGAYQDHVQRAATWVAANVEALEKDELGARVGGGASWHQGNWGWAHAAIFLGELHARTPDPAVKEALAYCAAMLSQTQEKSGGWAHGPGGKNALGYVELNIVTGLALCGLGLAQRNGISVSDNVLKRAEEYLKASSGGGGVGYSANGGQKGQGNIGRTAGCWLGYLALGRGKSKFGKSMGAYVKREADAVLNGHASLMQHIMLAGVAAHAAGSATARKFWKKMERDLVLAHTPDGSFQPRPWHESISMKSNSDVSFGEVWTTAAWTLVLVSEKTKDGLVGFPAWFGR